MTDPTERSGFSQLLAEIRRRRVGRFALGYAAAAFVLLQLAEIVFPAFGIGDNGLRVVVAVATLGFPPALVVAWMYDLTRSGITRTQGDPTGPWLHSLALGGLLVVTVLATGGAGVYLARQGVFESVEAVPTPSVPLTSASFDRSQPINSIAVLPIKDNSPGGEQAYFAASMHEELIAKLSQTQEIRVVSRTSTLQFADSVPSMPEVARRLGVDVVVEGSVIRTPQRTRVTLQIIHGPSDSHIRTLQWDREQIEDVLAFQTEVAHEVVEEVLAGHDEEPFAQVASNVEPAAQEAYFRGRFEYDRGTEEGYRLALQHFEEALDQDPEFAQALAGMAGARFMGALESESLSEDALLRAYTEADSALALDPTSAETREVFALIERSLPRFLDVEPPAPPVVEGERSMTIVQFPGRADSIVIDAAALDSAWLAPFTTLGERIEAQVRIATDRTADRMSFDARQLVAAGRYEEAEGILEGALSIDPESEAAWDMLLRTHVVRGDTEAAVSVAHRWSESGSTGSLDEASLQSLEAALDFQGSTGYWRWRAARLEAADRAGRPVPAFELASSYAALGDDERALQYLVRALRSGEPGVMSIRTDPVWDGLRSDERLRAIIREAQRIRYAPGRRRPGGGQA